MEKGIQRRETQTIPWRTDPDGLRQDTYSKAVKLTPRTPKPSATETGGTSLQPKPGYVARDLISSFFDDFRLSGNIAASELVKFGSS